MVDCSESIETVFLQLTKCWWRALHCIGNLVQLTNGTPAVLVVVIGDLLPTAAVSGLRLSSFYLNHFLLWFRFVKKQIIKFTEIIG